MVQTKCIVFGEVGLIRIRVKRFKQNLPNECSKSNKIAITACNISKLFPTLPDPLEPFPFFNLLQISSAEKNTLEKNVEIMPLTLFKIFRYATGYIKILRIMSLIVVNQNKSVISNFL